MDRPLTLASLAVLFALATLLLIEAAGRVFLLLWPAYDVRFLEPDREVGWKQVLATATGMVPGSERANDRTDNVVLNSSGTPGALKQNAAYRPG